MWCTVLIHHRTNLKKYISKLYIYTQIAYASDELLINSHIFWMHINNLANLSHNFIPIATIKIFILSTIVIYI